MATSEKEFRLTPDEASRMRNALKDEKFRKLLAEYAEEISDPDNKMRYEREITELEQMRGVDVKFINPTPGFVLKTVSLPDKMKAFVNICQSEMVEKATSVRGTGERGQQGEQWSIPFSLSPPREDVDKARKKCRVYDAVFHPETFQRGQENPRFKQLLVDTALDAIERELGVKLERSNIKYLYMPYKGMPAPTVIRKKKEEVADSSKSSDLPFTVPYPPLKKDVESQKKQKEKRKQRSPPDEPRYTVVHRGELTMQDFTNTRESTSIKRPRELIVTVELPNIDSAAGIALDIFEKRILLETTKPRYKLDLALSYPIEEDKGGAKFDKVKKSLTITLPVVPLQTTPPAVNPLVTEVATESTNQVQDPESHDLKTQESESTVTSDNAGGITVGSKLTNQNVEIAHDLDIHSTNQNAEVGSCVLGTKATNQKAEILPGVPHQWVSTGSYVCPPFSYRQDEESVSFVLHTAAVKETSLVSHFDQHQIQVTFKTASSAVDAGQRYSLFLRFPEGCLLCVEGCSVDVGMENVVVVGKKADESRVVWERFEVGPSATQTREKLFLTAANVQSTMEQLDFLPDPWAQEEGRREAKCEVSSVSEESLEITITSAETDGRVQERSELVGEEVHRGDVKEQSSDDGEPSTQSGGDVVVESSNGVTTCSPDAGSNTVDTGVGESEDLECGSLESRTVRTVRRGECEEEDPAMEHERHKEPSSIAAEHVEENPAIDPPSTAEANPDSRRGVSGCTASLERAGVEDQAAEDTPHMSDTGTHSAAAVVGKSHGAIQLSNKLMFALD